MSHKSSKKVPCSSLIVIYSSIEHSTRRVAGQTSPTSQLILHIKLSSAVGLTWMLGFVVPFTEVEFLDYLFVILNSLQGKRWRCGENTLLLLGNTYILLDVLLCSIAEYFYEL